MSLSVKTIGLLSGYTCKAFFGCKDIYVKKLTHQPQEERESQRSRLPEPSLGSSAISIRQVLSLHLLSPFFPFTGFLYVLYLPHTFFQLQISTCLGIKEKRCRWNTCDIWGECRRTPRISSMLLLHFAGGLEQSLSHISDPFVSGP